MCFGNWGTWVVERKTIAEPLVAEAGSQQASSCWEAGSRSPSSLLYAQTGLWELSLNLEKELGSDQKAQSSSSQRLRSGDLVNQSVGDVKSEDRVSLESSVQFFAKQGRWFFPRGHQLFPPSLDV